MGRPNTSNSADLSDGREKSDMGLLEDTIDTSPGGSTPSSTTNKEGPSHGYGGKDKVGDAADLRERFSFYGMTAPFMNFLVADKRLGRYMVLCITFIIYLMGSILLLISSLLSSANHAAALFILSLVFIAVGMSGVNGLLVAFVGDQYTTQRDGNVTTTRRGERVLIDRGRTIESIYNMYYWSINVGGLAGLATTELELHVGFWAAYLLPTCALSLSAGIQGLNGISTVVG